VPLNSNRNVTFLSTSDSHFRNSPASQGAGRDERHACVFTEDADWPVQLPGIQRDVGQRESDTSLVVLPEVAGDRGHGDFARRMPRTENVRRLFAIGHRHAGQRQK
jgi:hypothetical protein